MTSGVDPVYAGYLPIHRLSCGQFLQKPGSRAKQHLLLFRPLHIFIVVGLQTRRIVHTAVTRSPSDAWIAQQLREATPYLIPRSYRLHRIHEHYLLMIREALLGQICTRNFGGLNGCHQERRQLCDSCVNWLD